MIIEGGGVLSLLDCSGLLSVAIGCSGIRLSSRLSLRLSLRSTALYYRENVQIETWWAELSH